MSAEPEQPFFSSIFREFRKYGATDGRDYRDLRMPTQVRSANTTIPCMDATRVCVEPPPWLQWALAIVERDVQREGRELPLMTQTRMEELAFRSKFDVVVRVHERQKRIDAQAENLESDESDFWPGFPKGGLRNRYDYRR
jgi:hypothetical protein